MRLYARFHVNERRVFAAFFVHFDESVLCAIRMASTETFAVSLREELRHEVFAAHKGLFS